MKNIFLIAFICLLAACKQEQPQKDYAVIHGKIEGHTEKTALRLYDPETSATLSVQVDQNGNFRDTLKMKDPAYFNAIYDNAIFGLYLANGMDVELNFDANKFSETISFRGEGAAENRFLRYRSKKTNELMGADFKRYLSLENNEFNKKTAAYTDDLLANLLDNETTLDTAFVASEKANIENAKKSLEEQHKRQLEINAALGPGTASPRFTDYLNYKGGKNALEDFKGKYVYIDIWATWCMPCIYEMPFMNEIEREYEGRNINFIGISVDRKSNEEKWRKMIVERELMGTQLLADNEINSKFIQDFYIEGIPRFILLDPELNIINYDAPRPSDPALKALFETLNL